MKLRSLLVVAMAFSAIGSALANDSSSGCGLGWEVAPKQSLLSSAFRDTTNLILPNTFSMTSGTSGCAKHDIVKNEREQMYFVEANLEQLTLEMARGDGEYLRSFASVMGCDSSYGDFSTAVQKGYSKIFSGSVTPSHVLEGVKAEIRSNATLAKSCSPAA